ncbi:TIGR02680 family protein [Amycolatopsis thailandensis]|uniref:TIGR02680 family protein n=1 Tax=Amycolatopsis thailandensis TaxID=589330 RepID=UPI00363F9058
MTRFSPARAGVINLWDYRDEEFVFADGRLVLRGPNGSGKTKALEVLFPFVLDGRVDPRRLNPFASEERTMKSNLLYRGQDTAHSYVWMEFARQDKVVTVGVGMRAQKHNDRVTRWYFVVEGRVGVDFSLLGPDDRPLTKKQLTAEIGAEQVIASPSEYRAVIDASLFGLGAERYEQLLTLVLTLRRPQLAKHLDPKGLSRTLSDGLRPVDEDMVNEAARSFDDMESVQRTLDGLIKADEAAGAFLSNYATYLRTHARSAADTVTHRLDAAEKFRIKLESATSQREAENKQREDAEAEVDNIELELRKQQAHLDSLQRSKAYTDDREKLDQLSGLVDQLEAAARNQRSQAERTAHLASIRSAELKKAKAKVSDSHAEVARIAAELTDAAQDAAIEWTPEDNDAEDFADRISGRTEQRQDDVRAVSEALAQVTAERRRRDAAQRTSEIAESKVGNAETAEKSATEKVAEVRAEAAERLAGWRSRHDLGLPSLHEQLDGALDRVGEPDAPALPERFDALTRDAVHERRAVAHGFETECEQAVAGLAALRAERADIAEERDDAPPLFVARTAARVGRAGAPLWRLVRFADDVTAERAAALEAALEAANLLDAWLDEDSSLTEESDAYLVPLPEECRPAGPTLADVLRPEDDVEVSAGRVMAVLGSIALGEVSPLPMVPTVSFSGGFAQGVQVGAYTKPEVEYVGATARARRRGARLAEIDIKIVAAEKAVERLERELSRVWAWLRLVEQARSELPPTGAIVRALREQAVAVVELRVRREALDLARLDVDKAIAAVADRERWLVRVAAERSLPADGLNRVAAAIGRFGSVAVRLTSARRDQASRTEQAEEARDRFEEALRDAEEGAELASEAEAQHAEQAEGLTTLQESVGADVRRVTEEVRRSKRHLGELENALRGAREVHTEAVRTAALAEGAVTTALTELKSAVTETRTDADRLRPYARPDLLDLLKVPAGPVWPASEDAWRTDHVLPTDVLSLLESILAVTPDLRPSEASLKSSKTRVSSALDELQTRLAEAGHDYHPEWESDGDVIIVRVADEQGFASIGDFARRINASRRDQEQLLTESERRILEDALLGRLAQQIHDRTVDARDLIGRMDIEMRARRMSSGTGIGVRWELADNLDDGQRDISKLLERDASRLGPGELTRMREHFAARIKMARALPGNRSYTELLAEVMDYRKWRTFAFFLVSPDGSEDRLTQARHSTLSGGEQSVSLHLPLFAAAHVLLSSASADCPRLLALDEAFAGVDDKGRSELLQLTAQFDLDLFMTGYDLWATYATVPACAHYDLSHSAAEHTVSALLVVWDGKEMMADSASGSLAAELGSPGTRRRRSGVTLLEDDDAD